MTRSTNRQRLIAVFSMLVFVLAVLAFVRWVIAPAFMGRLVDEAPGRIAFLSNRDGNVEIYAMNEDGSQLVRLTDNDVDDASPMWSPDGHRLAFSSSVEGMTTEELFVMSFDGSAPLRLTTNDVQEGIPVWAPDGTAVAYVVDKPAAGVSEVRQASADGSGEKVLIQSATLLLYSLPTWSSDSQRLAFATQNRFGELGLAIVDRDDGSMTTVPIADLDVNGNGIDEVVWSPAEDRFAMVAWMGDQSGVFSMAVDGSSLTRFTETPYDQWGLTWSPDGSKLAFFQFDQAGLGRELFVINADGSGLTHFTAGMSESPYGIGLPDDAIATAVARIEERGGLSEAPFVTWSPDSSRLAFDSYWESPGIYTISVDGTGLVRLTEEGWWPVWGAGMPEPEEPTPTPHDVAPTEAPVDTPTPLPTSPPPGEDTPTTSPTQGPSATEAPVDTPTPLPTSPPPGEDTPAATLTSATTTRGGRIAFWSDRGGDAGIYILDVSTKRVTQLVNNLIGYGDLVWSPDGKHIAFSAPLDENYPYDGCWPNCRFGLYVMDSDGGNLVGLNEYPGHFMVPDWSPDGKYIAFTSTHDDPHPDTCNRYACNEEIYVMNIESGAITRLTHDPGLEQYPAWSPDGKRIAFLSNRELGSDFTSIYLMNADGSNVTRLPNENGRYGYVDWSPDEKRIAFYCNPGSGSCEWGFSMMDADGRNLTRPPDFTIWSWLVWSPDGKRFAFFSSTYPSQNEFFDWDIFVMNADGSHMINVTHNIAADRNPVWSPDGTRIAFESSRDDPRPDECISDPFPNECNYDIYVMDADGSNVIQLTDDPAHDKSPQWAPEP